MRSLIINGYLINTPIIQILRKIRSELNGNKLNIIIDDPENIRVTCPNPNHKGGHESHASCGIYVGDNDNIEYAVSHCFSCGFKASFNYFVATCFNCSIEDANNWLINNFSSGYIGEGILDLPEIDLNVKNKKIDYLNPKILESFNSWHPYIEKRKISRKIAELFQIKYDPKSESIVFPVYDENNNLVMLTRRSVNNKTFLIDKGKEKPVYLYNYVKEKDLREVIVCESQINALTCFSWGYPAIATFGCNVTPKQFNILNRSGIKHYYLAFDGDEAGKHGINLFLKNISSDVFVDVILLPQNKDINDLTLEEFQNLKIISSQEWLKYYK